MRARKSPRLVTAVRGRGLMLPFTLPDRETRYGFWRGCFEQGLLTVPSGEKSIRLRPYLDITPEVIKDAAEIMRR